MKCWIISAINTYSYESTETNYTVAATKEEAFEKFKEMVKVYLDEYKKIFAERYNKEGLSFKEYVELSKEFDSEWEFGYEESENEYILTASGKILNTLGDFDTEESVIKAFEVSSDTTLLDAICLLNNIEDVDKLYNSLC